MPGGWPWGFTMAFPPGWLHGYNWGLSHHETIFAILAIMKNHVSTTSTWGVRHPSAWLVGGLEPWIIMDFYFSISYMGIIILPN